MELKVIDKSGTDTGRKVSLSADIFNVEPNEHAIYLDVKQHLANKRQGTHKAKERAEIVGSTKKLKKQKGTGTARAGSIKSPVFRGGGRIFGPRPRDYHFKLNKKLKRLARCSALSSKAASEAITIVEDFTMDKPATRDYISVLACLEAKDTKSLMITTDENNNVYLSSRNLRKSHVVPCSQLHTYDILNAERIIIMEKALPVIEGLLNKKA